MKDDILARVGDEAMWLQLAEEASELSQAASKMVRYIHGTNPVYANDIRVIDPAYLWADVIEEYMDVVNCCEHLKIPHHRGMIDNKNKRWRERLGLEPVWTPDWGGVDMREKE